MLDGCGTMVPMCWLEILHVALDAAESFFSEYCMSVVEHEVRRV